MKVYVLLVLGLAALASGRRVRLRPIQQSEETLEAAQQGGVEYYAGVEQEDAEDDQRGRGAVLVSRQDNYGRANGQPRLQPKLKPAQSKEPPVQTIRNYNKLNDDGSFTFGYEAADGSFKEETRGTDCVVRGKYGYVDPDGNKREFTYVSGNPCDPNAVQDEEEEPGPIGAEENVPQNIPARRPIAKAARPVTTTSRPRPTTTVFQQSYGGVDDASDEEENLPPTPSRAPVVVTQRPALRLPTFAQAQAAAHETPAPARATPRPKLLVASPPARQSVNITPRPTQPPATTYRPQLVQFSSTPASAAKRPHTLDLDEELKNFQLEHNVIGSSRPRPDDDRPHQKPGGSPIYTSELVYDHASGQYNTVLYQQLPQTQDGGFSGDFNLRGRLQSFVQPQPQNFFQPRPFAARPPPPPAFSQPQHAFSQPAPSRQQPQSFYPQQQQSPPQQAYFQQQQASQLQQSQQLYASQQKKQQEQTQQRPDRRFPSSLLAQEPQRFGPPQPQRRPEPASLPLPSQPFYYVSPAGDRHSLSNGQIDAFLRGHSIAI
uniref:Cuticle protein 6 n=1 Tax=Lygus hesperus TaxID=30085 RepID=A0A0K8SEW3_LYGHE